jgi:hypothetical protein
MKLIKQTKRFKYYEDDNNQKTTHNTGEYDMLTCGCYRKPIQKKTHMALASCPLHPGRHYHMGILDTKPLDCFKYDKDGCIILRRDEDVKKVG